MHNKTRIALENLLKINKQGIEKQEEVKKIIFQYFFLPIKHLIVIDVGNYFGDLMTGLSWKMLKVDKKERKQLDRQVFIKDTKDDSKEFMSIEVGR